MAKAEINIVVNGEEKLKQLNKDVSELDSQSKLSTKSLVGWTAALAATGYAINQVVSAGSEYLKNLEDTNNAIVTTTELETQLSTSFGMASASLLEYTGVWDAYREVLVEVSNVLDAVAGKEAILRQARAESRAFNEETVKMEKENAKWREAEHKKELARIKREDDANVRHQKLLTAFEEKAQQDAKASEQAYEDKLAALDANIDKIYAETDAQIANSQVKEEAVAVTDDLTDSIEKQANAHERAATTSVTMSADANQGGIIGKSANVYADPTFERWRAEQAEWSRQQARYLKDIADASRDSNDAIRGF